MNASSSWMNVNSLTYLRWETNRELGLTETGRAIVPKFQTESDAKGATCSQASACVVINWAISRSRCLFVRSRNDFLFDLGPNHGIGAGSCRPVSKFHLNTSPAQEAAAMPLTSGLNARRMVVMVEPRKASNSRPAWASNRHTVRSQPTTARRRQPRQQLRHHRHPRNRHDVRHLRPRSALV